MGSEESAMRNGLRPADCTRCSSAARALILAAVAVPALARAAPAPAQMAEAKAHFEAGAHAYDEGNYELALHEFEKSHALSLSPALYFNMAACEEHRHRLQAAAILLRQYLIENPAAQDRSKIEARIVRLETEDEQARRPREVVVPPPAPTPPLGGSVQRRRPYGWVALAASAALAVGAAAVGGWALADYGTLKNSCGTTNAGCSASQIDAMRTGAHVTDVLIGTAAAAAVVTLVLFVVDRPRAVAQRAALAGRPVF
jgi:hypothetical protein